MYIYIYMYIYTYGGVYFISIEQRCAKAAPAEKKAEVHQRFNQFINQLTN